MDTLWHRHYVLVGRAGAAEWAASQMYGSRIEGAGVYKPSIEMIRNACSFHGMHRFHAAMSYHGGNTINEYQPNSLNLTSLFIAHLWLKCQSRSVYTSSTCKCRAAICGRVKALSRERRPFSIYKCFHFRAFIHRYLAGLIPCRYVVPQQVEGVMLECAVGPSLRGDGHSTWTQKAHLNAERQSNGHSGMCCCVKL